MSDSADKIRYSDEELMEFKRVILEKLETAKRNYEQLKAVIQSEDSHPTFEIIEDGTNTLHREEAGQRAQRQMEFIKKLQTALVRIENKTYGVCRVTGKLIPKGRLMAVPHTTLSVEGKEMEQMQKNKKR